MNKFGERLPMKEAKEKLKNLKVEDDVDGLINEFCRYISSRLNDVLRPEGFVMRCELALDELRAGTDSRTGEAIRSRIACLPPVIYDGIRMRIPEIAKQIFPEEFSNGVEEFMKEVDKIIKKE